MARVLDSNFEVSESELQLHCYFHSWTNTLGKNMSLILVGAQADGVIEYVGG